MIRARLPGRLARGIDIDDEQALPPAIRQATSLLLGEAVREAVLLKERPQGLQAGCVDSSEEARERAAVRQLLTTKQGHEGTGKGRHPLIKGGQGPLSTDGIAKEHRQKIDHVVLTHAPSRQMHLVSDRIEDSTTGQVLG